MNFNFSANLGASDAGNLDAGDYSGELPTSNEIHVRAQEELKRYNTMYTCNLFLHIVHNTKCTSTYNIYIIKYVRGDT